MQSESQTLSARLSEQQNNIAMDGISIVRVTNQYLLNTNKHEAQRFTIQALPNETFLKINGGYVSNIEQYSSHGQLIQRNPMKDTLKAFLIKFQIVNQSMVLILCNQFIKVTQLLFDLPVGFHHGLNSVSDLLTNAQQKQLFTVKNQNISDNKYVLHYRILGKRLIINKNQLLQVSDENQKRQTYPFIPDQQGTIKKRRDYLATQSSLGPCIFRSRPRQIIQKSLHLRSQYCIEVWQLQDANNKNSFKGQVLAFILYPGLNMEPLPGIFYLHYDIKVNDQALSLKVEDKIEEKSKDQSSRQRSLQVAKPYYQKQRSYHMIWTEQQNSFIQIELTPLIERKLISDYNVQIQFTSGFRKQLMNYKCQKSLQGQPEQNIALGYYKQPVKYRKLDACYISVEN